MTAGPGLLDSSGERVTLQDASAAVLLRLPSGASVSVGQRIRAVGTMGTYYGAPQLTSSSVSVAGQASVQPTGVHAAPLAPALEWRLVSVSGTVDVVHKDGDAWRAELIVPGGSIPIVGLDRSGIPSTALIAGRAATIEGIVKRAYPTATDQRLAVVPRSGNDLKATPAPLSSPASSHGPGPSSRPGGGTVPLGSGPPPSASGLVSGTSATAAAGDPSVGPNRSASTVALAELGLHIGGQVRVGGQVVDTGGAMIWIDDGSARAVVRLRGEAADIADGLRAGDLVNLSGLVSLAADGEIEVLVDDPAALTSLRAVVSAPMLAEQNESEPPVAVAHVPVSDPTTDTRPIVAVIVLLAVAAGCALLGLVAAGRERRANWRLALASAAVSVRARLPAGRADRPQRG